jgi:C-terminal processing protease CtpA/Prc
LVVGQVAYIKKGTPAESTDLVRGAWFNKVNGIQLTTSNYGSLMSVTDDQVTLGLLNETYTDEGDFIDFVEGPSITIQTVAEYAENPVYMDSVYVIGSSRVGYLVYNFFAQDNGDESLDYDVAMNHVFGRFKNNHITDLVLDLRYNSGGRAISSQHLASMIVPGLDETEVFAFLRYNDYWNNYYIDKYGESELNTYFTKSILKGSDVVEEINNVGSNLTRLYVLTGDFTASASEEIINGLKPYMDVILIGETTYGKNVGSISIYEEDDPNNTWAMQLIIAKFFNSRGESDFTEGFEPDYPMMDTGIVGIKPLGDTTESLLNKALSLATGSQVAASVVTRSAIVQKNRVLRTPSQVNRGLQLEKPNHLN